MNRQLRAKATIVTANPYTTLPDKAFWRRAVARLPRDQVDPVGDFRLRIDVDTRVATGGSCFAQHIARHLSQAGYFHLVTEPGHPILASEVRRASNYGLFSCRYGNIYTARQLVQLFDRAYGRFEPEEDVWIQAPDVVLDPFRPRVEPGGFNSEAEMRADRAQHLSAVRTMFESLDVFIFTLGLTECWRSRSDGAVFPLCPGVEGGTFDPDRHEFYNQPVEDVVSDLAAFAVALRTVNPAAQIVLTVSPVPLVATAQPGEHVLSATAYSKSVLRVAADSVRRRMSDVHYFPALEIITGAFNRGEYFGEDLRDVRESGVQHVMRLFMHHAAGANPLPAARSVRDAAAADSSYIGMAERLINVECDERALDRA